MKQLYFIINNELWTIRSRDISFLFHLIKKICFKPPKKVPLLPETDTVFIQIQWTFPSLRAAVGKSEFEPGSFSPLATIFEMVPDSTIWGEKVRIMRKNLLAFKLAI